MKIKPKYIAIPSYFFYKTLCFTLRIKEFGREKVDELDKNKSIMVFSLWHDELFSLMHVKRQLRIFTLVSPSRDGDYLANLLEQLGIECIRGSSSRKGTSALLIASKKMQTEYQHACLTVDGPRGPRHIAKYGAGFLASNSNAYIVPVRIKMHNSIKFNSWDKFQIPLPFSRIDITFSEPYQIEQCDSEDFYSEQAEKLTSILNSYD